MSGQIEGNKEKGREALDNDNLIQFPTDRIKPAPEEPTNGELLLFPKINYTDLDGVMEGLNEAYEAEEIKGLLLVVKNHDDSFVVTQAGDLDYLEKIGMLEHLKFEILMDED